MTYSDYTGGASYRCSVGVIFSLYEKKCVGVSTQKYTHLSFPFYCPEVLAVWSVGKIEGMYAS